MKLFEKVTNLKGGKDIYLLGLKVFSYQRKKYKKLSEGTARSILQKQFKKTLGYQLNLDNPQTFNEKIQWLKLYYRNPLMTKCADKIGVREYVSEILGENYLIPLIGIYETPDDIDFDSLPNKFVLKVNWGSGQNIICTDKSSFDIESAKRSLSEWMKPHNNHYYHSFEWAYKDIVPKILVEEFIDGVDDVIDYKFFCYDGQPKNMFLVQNRALGKDKMTLNFFDEEFKPLPFERLYKASTLPIEKPSMWEEMIDTARLLSKPFAFVRVDFYMIDNQIKVGELTFYPGNGMEPFSPVEWDMIMGSFISLPKPTPWEED